MVKLKRIIWVVGILGMIAINACTTLHSGGYDSSIVVSEGKYAYKRKVVFETHYSYTLGLGGGKVGFLMDRLREELYSRAKLKDGEELINILISTKSTFFLVFSRVDVRITGDVIDWGSNDFVGRNESEEFQTSLESLKRAESPTKQKKHLVEFLSDKENLSFVDFKTEEYPQIGEAVFYIQRDVLATVVSTTFNKYKICYFTTSSTEYKTTWVYKNQIQKITEKHSFKIIENN
ncbi:MAG: hypothetical protein H6599_02585 [Flavobacteriales bacterium]|nr:hypothetical protein [Flavobacteriales bacterium]